MASIMKNMSNWSGGNNEGYESQKMTIIDAPLPPNHIFLPSVCKGLANPAPSV